MLSPLAFARSLSNSQQRRTFIQSIPDESTRSEAMVEFVRSIPNLRQRRAYIQTIPVENHRLRALKELEDPFFWIGLVPGSSGPRNRHYRPLISSNGRIGSIIGGSLGGGSSQGGSVRMSTTSQGSGGGRSTTGRTRTTLQDKINYIGQHRKPLTSDENKLLESFIDPISRDIFVDPVMCQDGHTYERHMIQQHFKTNNTSPSTNERLGDKTLIPNHAMRSATEAVVNHLYSNLKKRVQTTTMSELSDRTRQNPLTRQGLQSTRQAMTRINTPSYQQQSL